VHSDPLCAHRVVFMPLDPAWPSSSMQAARQKCALVLCAENSEQGTSLRPCSHRCIIALVEERFCQGVCCICIRRRYAIDPTNAYILSHTHECFQGWDPPFPNIQGKSHTAKVASDHAGSKGQELLTPPAIHLPARFLTPPPMISSSSGLTPIPTTSHCAPEASQEQHTECYSAAGHGKDEISDIPSEDEQHDDIIYVMCTSASTGSAKAVCGTATGKASPLHSGLLLMSHCMAPFGHTLNVLSPKSWALKCRSGDAVCRQCSAAFMPQCLQKKDRYVKLYGTHAMYAIAYAKVACRDPQQMQVDGA